MLKTSALVVLTAFVAAWVVAPGLFQSSAAVRSHGSQPAPVAAVASEPAAANPAMRIIVPAGFDAPAGEI